MLRKLAQEINEKKNLNKKQKRYSELEKAMHAVFMLEREEQEGKRSNVKDYAEKKDISRTTLYKIRDEILSKFSGRKPGPKRGSSEELKAKEEAGKLKKLEENMVELDLKLGRVAEKLPFLTCWQTLT